MSFPIASYPARSPYLAHSRGNDQQRNVHGRARNVRERRMVARVAQTGARERRGRRDLPLGRLVDRAHGGDRRPARGDVRGHSGPSLEPGLNNGRTRARGRAHARELGAGAAGARRPRARQARRERRRDPLPSCDLDSADRVAHARHSGRRCRCRKRSLRHRPRPLLAAKRSSRDLTLVETEALEALRREHSVELPAAMPSATSSARHRPQRARRAALPDRRGRVPEPAPGRAVLVAPADDA